LVFARNLLKRRPNHGTVHLMTAEASIFGGDLRGRGRIDTGAAASVSNRDDAARGQRDYRKSKFHREGAVKTGENG